MAGLKPYDIPMIRKGIRPDVRPALDRPAGAGEYRRVLPFRRSWLAIGLLAAFDAVFIIPAVMTYQQALGSWARLENLFDLVSALFLSAWLLGWSIAPIVMTAILAMMLFGREVVRARPGEVEVFIGLPLFGLAGCYRAAGLRNLRLETPAARSSRSWRGTHLVFEYGANTHRLGSDLDEADRAEISRGIEVASGFAVRNRDASSEELAGEWPTDPGMELLNTPAEADSPIEPAVAGPVTLASPSAVVLIIANLIPVAGFLLWDWSLSDVMVLYWAESGVIGLFNLGKMAVISRWLAIPGGLFFLSHYGAFMSVHFLFIYGIFVEGMKSSSGGDLSAVAELFRSLWPALAALFISHGVSFFVNFLGRREYAVRDMRDQMTEPYSRIVFMHLVLIFGGGLALVLGQPTPVLLIVIALKIGMDLRAHLRERARDPRADH